MSTFFFQSEGAEKRIVRIIPMRSGEFSAKFTRYKGARDNERKRVGPMNIFKEKAKIFSQDEIKRRYTAKQYGIF
ncbi:MAG: hypothetical protein ABH865_06465 [Candidatus Omnitrophota bacterium]|nr:hypothetical protein [Candidatus Omnitrophota bacterium]